MDTEIVKLPPEPLFRCDYNSVITACITVTIILIALCIMVQSDKLLRKIGVSSFIFLIGLVVVRIVVPIEFRFAREIYLYNKFKTLKEYFTYKLFEVNNISISTWELLLIIWFTVSVIILIIKLYRYMSLAHFGRALPSCDWDSFFEQYCFDASDYKDIRKIKLVFTDYVDSPYLVGFKTYCILLPNRKFTKEQMKYIILHEYMHVVNKDIYLKILLDTVCSFIWWNPLFYYVKRKLFFLIEMRNDAKISAKLSKHEQIVYMECLKDTAAIMAGKQLAYGIAFNKNSFRELKRRLNFLATEEKRSKSFRTLTCVFVFVLWVGSWSFVFQPYHADYNVGDEDAIPMTKENTILINKDDGSYEVYVDGMYIFTTDEDGLRAFPLVPIYNSLEEVP